MAKVGESFISHLRMLGRKAVIWLSLGMVAGLIVSAVEIVLSIWIQVFLVYLGMTSKSISFLGLTLDSSFSFHSILLALLVIGVLRSLCQFFMKQSALMAMEMINRRLRMISLYEILRREGQSFVSAADTNVRIGEIFPKTALACYHFSLTIPEFIQVGVFSLLVFASGWQFAVIGIPGVVIIGLLQKSIHKHVKTLSNKIPGEQYQLVSGIERVARNWLLVKVLRTQGHEYGRLLKNIHSYSGYSIRAHMLATIGSALPNLCGIVLLIGILKFALSFDNGVSGSQVVSFLYLFFRLVQNLALLADHIGVVFTHGSHLRESLAYFKSFTPQEIAAATAAPVAKAPAGVGFSPQPESEGVAAQRTAPPRVEVRNLTVRYEGEAQPVLSDLSFTIEGGHIFGIIGRSGSGKSTLLAAILGVMRQHGGEIIIGGETSSSFYQEQFATVGYVGAEPFLITGSILDNLHYGAAHRYSADEIHKALEKSALIGLVHSVSEGIHHQLKENGEGLSAGQKQRLGLARALARNPRLLVLDEFTANLDKETEMEILHTLKTLRGQVTVVLVTHRDTVLQFCDEVLDLDEFKRRSPPMEIPSAVVSPLPSNSLDSLEPSFNG